MFTKYQAEFLSIALTQPEAGPQSLGTPVLVLSNSRSTPKNDIMFGK